MNSFCFNDGIRQELADQLYLLWRRVAWLRTEKMDNPPPPEEIYMPKLAGESPLSTNTFAEPENIAIVERVVRADDIVLPPHSFAMLEVGG